MAEDSYKKGFNTAVKVILGLILVIVGVLLIIRFWPSVCVLIKAGIGFVLLLGGAVILAIAKD